MRPLPQNHTAGRGLGKGQGAILETRDSENFQKRRLKRTRVHLDHTSEYTDKEGEVQGCPGHGQRAALPCPGRRA